MSFNFKYDDNGKLISDAIVEVYEYDPISCSSVLTDLVLSVPSGSYGYRVFRCPVDLKVRVNGQSRPYSVDEGDVFTTYFHGINEMKISTSGTDASPIIIQFLI